MALVYKDYYGLLGIAPEATVDEVKAAYRKAARKFHPDVNKAKDAHAKFVEIGEAYEALADPQKRAAYDRLRQAGYREGQEIEPMGPPPGYRGGSGEDMGGGFSSEHFTDVDPEAFSDFFQSMFGQAGGPRGRRRSSRAAYHERGEDAVHPLAVTLQEAYAGGQRRLQMEVPEVDAQGQMRHGTRTLEVKIPVGVTDGTKIRLRGQGTPGTRPDLNGDLYLEIHIEPHPFFTVEERTVHLQLPISPWEAVLGATIAVPTLGGAVSLKIPPNSKVGDKLRLKGRGLPGTPPGDEIVSLVVVVPSTTTDEEKQALKTWAAASKFNPRAPLGV
jgi:curved DNA-binding protein